MKSGFQLPDDAEPPAADIDDLNWQFVSTALNAEAREQLRADLPESDAKFISHQRHPLQAMMVHHGLAVYIVSVREAARAVEYSHKDSDLADGLIAKKLLTEAGYTPSRVPPTERV